MVVESMRSLEETYAALPDRPGVLLLVGGGGGKWFFSQMVNGYEPALGFVFCFWCFFEFHLFPVVFSFTFDTISSGFLFPNSPNS